MVPHTHTHTHARLKRVVLTLGSIKLKFPLLLEQSKLTPSHKVTAAPDLCMNTDSAHQPAFHPQADRVDTENIKP